MKKIGYLILGWILSFTALTHAIGEETATWIFNVNPKSDIISTNGKYKAVLKNLSGQAGIKSDSKNSFLHIPGTNSNDYLSLGDFDFGKKFSVEVLFRPHSSPAKAYTMIVGNRFNQQFQLDWTNSAGGTVEFFVGGGDLKLNRICKSYLKSEGNWMHIVAVYDPTVSKGDNQWLYINGKLVGAIKNPAELSNCKYPLRLAQNSTINMKANVKADWREISIYNNALPLDEIKEKFEKKRERAVKITSDSYNVSLDPERWREKHREKKASQDYVDRLSGTIKNFAILAAYASRKKKNGNSLSLELDGRSSMRSGTSWVQKFSKQLDLRNFKYCIIKCKAEGLMLSFSSAKVISLTGINNTELLDASELIQDGMWHTYFKKIPAKLTTSGIEIDLFTKNSSACLEVSSITFCRDIKHAKHISIEDGWKNIKEPTRFKQITGIPFNNSLNNILKKVLLKNTSIDALENFGSSKIAFGGIPFVVNNSGCNILTPADGSMQDVKEKVDAFGEKVIRKYFFPEDRNDKTTMAINRKASEIFLLLATDLPASRRRYSLPTAPCSISMIEGFSVDIIYTDNSRETAFPYSISADGYIIQGNLDAYCIPVNNTKEIKEIILYNKIPGYTVSLAAVSLNTSDNRIYQKILKEDAPIKIAAPPEISSHKASITGKENIFVLENSFYSVKINCKKGFSITAIKNKFSPSTLINFDPASGLEIKSGDVLYSGNYFQFKGAEQRDNTLRLKLAGKINDLPLNMTVSFKVNQSPQLEMTLQVKNCGSKSMEADFRFPKLNNMSIGDNADTWYFFPQYRNVLTKSDSFCKQPNHRGFLMQFMDVFNPSKGSGLSIMTHNMAQEPIQYCMGKNNKGISTYIENEGEDYCLESGKTIEFCKRVLVFHHGDWHEGARAYQQWVRSWYHPFHSQDKEYFKKAVWVRSHIPSPYFAKRILKTKPLMDFATKKFIVDEVIAEDIKYLGLKPDVFHFWGWAFKDRLLRDGEYSYEDYKNLGGIANFRKIITYIQNKLNMPVSLYTIWDRYNKDTKFYKEYTDKFALIREGNRKIVTENKVSISVGVKIWREHAMKTLKKLQNDTGVKMLYLDVFATDDRARDFGENRGHDIPSRVAAEDTKFLKTLRESIPPSTTVWGEFPIPDVGSQYWDGFITYDFIPLYEHLVEVYNSQAGAPSDSLHLLPVNIFRFIFPNLRQCAFPVGQEGFIDSWAYMKFLLFNGYALFDTTWRLYTKTCRRNLSKSLNIMRKYADCFSSEKPEMFVPTMRSKVYANKFPGKNRTVWTLYNARYRTIIGNIIELRHEDGAEYYDLWNGKVIKPEIKGGKAVISLEMLPQQIGCIIQEK